MSKKLLYSAFWAVVVVTSVDFVSRTFYLYWSTRWLDTVSHFLGGVAIGLLTLWFISLFKKIKFSKLEVVLWSVAGTMIIGVGWEVFEYLLNIAGPSIGETYTFDTTLDLSADLIGAIVASRLVIKSILSKHE
jgi:hypothetical protein